ncbi:MAG: N-acetyltransferase family protein [Planctomycetota bacterium]
MSNGSLRLAEPRDFGSIAELTNEFIRRTAVHFGAQPVTAAELEDLWRGKQERYPWLVAECEDQFAGYAKAGTWRERAAYAWTAETTIYMVERFRGRGVGKRLYRRLIDLLHAQGFRSLIGGITLPNDASVGLHEELGFVSIGVVADAGFKFGRWHDVGFWQKRLVRDAEAQPGPILAPAVAWQTLAALD